MAATPSDVTTWSITLIATRAGVDIVLSLPTLTSEPIALSVGRAEARAFANAILAAAGDAAHRTFPRPQILESADG